MTFTFFVYLLIVTTLLAGAAAAAEWGAPRRGATRHIWTAAIALSILGPATAITWQVLSQREGTADVVSLGALTSGVTELAPVQMGPAHPSVWTDITQAVTSLRSGVGRFAESMPQWSPQAAKLALAAWLLLSLALSIWLLASVYSLRRSQREWKRMTIDGVDVDVSPSAGPAVFGFTSHRIVLPEWATRLELERRQLIIAHESEHIKARDPQRLAMALVTLMVMPWNIALWWCAARLRRAIELDCDDRVLRRFPDAKEYGYVLLHVASRGRNSSRLAIPMVSLLRMPSELELRLRAMSRTRKSGYRSAVMGAVVALVAVSAAFTAPAPWPAPADAVSGVSANYAATDRASDTVPDRARQRLRDSLTNDSIARTVERGQANPNQTYFAYQVEKPAYMRSGSPEYPAKLRSAGIEGEVDVEFTVDTSGRVDPNTAIKVTKSTNDLFEAAVLSALPIMRFSPAEVGGRKVKQLVQEPFTFAISNSTEPSNPHAPYSAKQVEKPVAFRRGSPMPQYPPSLRAQGAGGEVHAQFVVDTLGRVERGSIRLTMSTNRQFAEAVLTALPNMLFIPAEIGGKKVRQLAQEPFTFTISHQ
ncbi:MAG: TonB family protein [Gemmatimonadaceae bacterium]